APRRTVLKVSELGAPGRPARLTMNDGHETPHRRARFAMDVKIRIATADDLPGIAECASNACIDSARATGECVAKRGRIERHAGNRFEHRLGASALEDAAVARQKQRRIVAARREDKERLSEWGDGLESCRGWSCQTCEEAAAKS